MRLPRKHLWRACIALAILLPSFLFIWKNRTLPQFGYLHDDGILFVTAKSIASAGYRIESLPGDLWQTKFPPLYPLFLAIVWKINPHFPENMNLAAMASWMALAAYIALAWIWYRRSGLPEAKSWILAALLGLNPYIIWFGSMLFSDLFYSCWLLAALIVVARPTERSAALAGILAGCAYLARTSGVVLLVSIPAWYFWRRRPRHAAVFAAAMLPFVAAWSLWVRFHVPQTSDLATLYYTDYLRYLMRTTISDLPVILWKNVDQLLYSMGSMALPRVSESLPMKILTQVIAVAMIAGTVRLARRKFGLEYALFAAASIGILLVWNFPATERFILPLYPLLLAGLATEAEHMWNMFKAGFSHKDRSQRVAARAFSVVAASVLVAGLCLQVFMSFSFLQATVEQKQAKLRDQQAAYTWISANLPATAAILSYDDPLLYLYTGRRSVHRPLDPLWWYREDHASIQAAYRDLAAYCRSRGLQYIYFTTDDLGREAGGDDQREAQYSVMNNPDLKPLFTAGIGTVYRVEPAAQTAEAHRVNP